ncbi:TnsA-like heteromeric transposase endonuclease subunit [Leifsonia sp. LS1]|uniref:TnsA-like heteromeric transposase endonuclease subunit n=1 Tax=Leifsonia sp. LS1 TaxID=2828483 RepID=UPI001CFCAEF0|nr:TnsA-like heteromeric transposase endonuclease subunit [Leifsonia sp. LS1]
MSPAESWEAAIAQGGARTPMPVELQNALALLHAEIVQGEGRRARLFRPVKGPRRIRLPQRQPHETGIRILLSRDGRTAYGRSVGHLGLEDLVHCHPMRDFSRRHGQPNKPVAFFSRTVGDLISCESQHERRFAILADWNEDVVHIAAQPFTIDFPPGHEFDSHTPDFVLIGRSGIVVVVDVKWPSAALTPEAVRRHAAVEQALRVAGIRHVVWTDAPSVVTSNLALFAAARVPQQMLAQLEPAVLAARRPGVRVRDLVETVTRGEQVPAPVVLTVVRRMLWEHHLDADLLTPFSADSVLL